MFYSPLFHLLKGPIPVTFIQGIEGIETQLTRMSNGEPHSIIHGFVRKGKNHIPVLKWLSEFLERNLSLRALLCGDRGGNCGVVMSV